MKINKIAALWLAAGLFVACADDDASWNGADATVSMGQTEISVKENKGIFNVPIVVDGTLNGPVKVMVEVAETGANPAMDDVHYYVTSKSIVIAPDDKKGNIEIATVDDPDINEARTFTVTITHVEGAKIGQSTTTITLRDNDSAFYEKLQGAWKLSGVSPYSGDIGWDVKIVGHEEGQDGYDEVLYITGMMGYDWTQATLLYHFDAATQKVTLSIPLGTMFASGVNFGNAGINDIFLGTAQDGKMVFEGSVAGECNSDFTSITFEPTMIYFFLAPQGTGKPSGSVWDAIGQITMTRK